VVQVISTDLIRRSSTDGLNSDCLVSEVTQSRAIVVGQEPNSPAIPRYKALQRGRDDKGLKRPTAIVSTSNRTGTPAIAEYLCGHEFSAR
jgi:hypothetical protein